MQVPAEFHTETAKNMPTLPYRYTVKYTVQITQYSSCEKNTKWKVNSEKI